MEMITSNENLTKVLVKLGQFCEVPTPFFISRFKFSNLRI